MAYRLFEGKEHAASYVKFRTSPSNELVQRLIDFVEKQEGKPLGVAVDVGCGSGQGTVLLAKHFASVLGTDVSAAQIDMAMTHAAAPNITYRQSPAEQLPCEDASVDLLSAMSAFHWFDRPRFLREAHRVLRPRGCLALLNYVMDMELHRPDCGPDALNQVCKEFYEALRPYRSPHLSGHSIDLYREAFQALPYPDKEWNECVRVRKPMPLSSYVGMVESFSSFQALLRKNPQEAEELSSNITQRLMSVMKVTSPDTEVVVEVKYFYLLACKPAED